MKRIVSLMLAAVLVLAPCMQSFATEPDSKKPAGEQTADLNIPAVREGIEPEENPPEGGDTEGEDGIPIVDPGNTQGEDGIEPTEEESEEPSDDISLASEDGPNIEDVKSQIDVRIVQALDFKSPIEFNITLTDPEGDSESKTIELGSLTSDTNSTKLEDEVTFNGEDGSGLEDGKYKLSISAPGYRTRYREITVKSI